jgi:dTDP-4-dehydrorhamnose 3,5-epimerase
MIFTETPLPGAFVIELERHQDQRGHLARTYCRDEFVEHRLDPTVAQCSVSMNERAGTLRGMHYQAEPHGETKLVRCTRGSVYDVIVDLRPDSPTHRRWFAIELTADNGLQIFAPVGIAHGFQTLEDRSEILYQMGAAYVASLQRGMRFDDPEVEISWPEAPSGRIVSERDLSFPPLSDLSFPH